MTGLLSLKTDEMNERDVVIDFELVGPIIELGSGSRLYLKQEFGSSITGGKFNYIDVRIKPNKIKEMLSKINFRNDVDKVIK